jgi:mycothiol synthase
VSPAQPSAIAGLTWRPLTHDDAEALHALLRASEVADKSRFVTSLDEVRQLMADPELSLAVDSLGGVLPDGGLACFAAVQMRDLAVKRRAVNLFGSVHPEFRRRGLGSAILGWSEKRGVERFDDHRDDLPRFLEVWSDERSTDRRLLFTASGYGPIRYYEEMLRPLSVPIPAAELEGGLRFELWSPALDEAVRLAHNEAFADHWGSQPLGRESWVHRFVGSPYFRPDLSWSVMDGAEVAGYCLAYHSAEDARASGRMDGWLGQIGVRRPWRKRGIATAIICHVMSEMARAGLDHAVLQVDSDNPSGAAGLYRRLGFATEQREIRWAKEV